MKLTSISLKSCAESHCAYQLDIVGSNEGDSWESVCEIREAKDAFFGKIKLEKSLRVLTKISTILSINTRDLYFQMEQIKHLYQ